MSEDTQWITIRVPKDVYQDAKTRKEEHGVTWGQYVNPHAWHSVFDAPSDAPNGRVESTTDVASDEIANQLVAEMDSMAFNGQVEDHKADEIIGRIKDLHTEIESLKEALQR